MWQFQDDTQAATQEMPQCRNARRDVALSLRSCLLREDGLHNILRGPYLWFMAAGSLGDIVSAGRAAKLATEATTPDR